METWVSTIETSVQPPSAPKNETKSRQPTPAYYEPFGRNVQKELTYLKKLLSEKDARIKQLTQENEFLYAELERLQTRIDEEFKRSDVLIDQMQVAAAESNKRAHAIIMQLSRQIERQAEQIEILQQAQGFGEAVREKLQYLKSKIPPLRIGSIKQALQSHFSTIR